MRLVAFSDLHLDAPFAKGGPELVRLRRGALREALAGVAALARRVDAAALMCAGDLFEHDRISPDTAELLRRTFEELSPMPVLLSPGNHDWYGPASIYATTAWSKNVHVFASARLTPFELSNDVVVWGAAHHAPSGTGGLLDDFSVGASSDDVSHRVHLGLFHGSEESDFTLQVDPDKVMHSPFRAEQIAAAGLAHAVVGHYHRRREAPTHTYPGNPAPLSFGERGDGGAVVLEIDPGVEGGVVSREWYPICSLALHDLVLDITGLGDAEAVVSTISAQLASRTGVGRLTLVGEVASTLDLGLVLSSEPAHSLDQLELRVGRVTEGFDLERIRDEPTVRGQFVRDVLDSELADDEQRRVIATGLRALSGRDDLEVA
jgi:DNA repair protein SbcD/Mre11